MQINERNDCREATAMAYREARDGRTARALIDAHDNLVHGYANQLHPPCACVVDRDDLVSVGRTAILLAVDTWEPRKGPWGPYAYCKMQHAMVNALRAGDAISRHHRKKGDITMVSIDTPDQNGTTPADRLQDASPAPSARIERRSLHREFRARISEMPIETRRLLSLRYRHGMWMKEIGQLLGITESAVSHRLKKTLTSMRRMACDIA